jgi:hypothetical protein
LQKEDDLYGKRKTGKIRRISGSKDEQDLEESGIVGKSVEYFTLRIHCGASGQNILGNSELCYTAET